MFLEKLAACRRAKEILTLCIGAREMDGARGALTALSELLNELEGACDGRVAVALTRLLGCCELNVEDMEPETLEACKQAHDALATVEGQPSPIQARVWFDFGDGEAKRFSFPTWAQRGAFVQGVSTAAEAWGLEDYRQYDTAEEAAAGEWDDGVEVHINPAADLDLHLCDNCRSEWRPSDLKTIKDLEQRIDPGGMVPSGECPDCGALCYSIEQIVVSDGRKSCRVKNVPGGDSDDCVEIHVHPEPKGNA